MVDTKLSHSTYKFVDEKEAYAFAWIFIDAKSPMKKVAIKLPELKPNEIRAKVVYVGLCHSDLHLVRGDWGFCPYPIAPGHEIVGEITNLGSDVKDFKVGETVGFGCQRECCGQCEPCKTTADNLCTSKNLEQKYTYGPKYWGGYATSFQQPADFFFKLPKGLPLERVPPLFCAGITTYAPIARYAKPGQEVAVLGIGGLGHMAVMYAKAWGCKVTAFTSSKDKEKFIKDLGADRVVVSNEETFKQEAGKFHLILNTLPSGTDFTPLVGLARVMGTFVQLGLPPGDKPVGMDIVPIVYHHIVFTGSGIGSRKEIREMLEFSAKHNIVPLCEGFDFEHFPQALDRLEHGRPIFRCVVDARNAWK